MENVIPIDSDRAVAMRWLQSRLQWETTLNNLRDPFPSDHSLAESDSPETQRAA